MDSSNNESLEDGNLEYLKKANQSQNSNLFRHSIALSEYINQNQILNQKLLAPESFKNINQLISEVVNCLSHIESFPNIDIGQISTINEVYHLLSCVLYIVFQSNSALNRDLSNENQSLKNELSNLQKQYGQLIQNNSTLQDISKSPQRNNSSSQLGKRNLQIGKDNEIEKYKEMEKEVINLIIYLKSHFNLSESTNLYNIIDAINIKCTCEISEKDRIEQLMIQNQDLENRLMNLQQEKYEIEKKLFEQNNVNSNEIDSQIFILENEINTLKSELKNIAEKCESRKAKSQALTKTINEQNDQIKQLTRDLETSKIKYDKLLIDFEDKKKNNDEDDQIIISKNDLKIKDDEIANLHNALNELSIQLEKTNEDLMSEASMKNHLFNAFQAQNELMNMVEKQMKDNQQKKNEQNSSKIQLKSSIMKNISNDIEDDEEENVNSNNNINNNSNNENIISDLRLFIEKSDLKKSEIEKINGILQNEGLPISMKLINMVNSIMTISDQKSKKASKESDELNDEESLKSQNLRLKKYMANLLYFIEKVTSSGEMQEFFIESDINYDFREKLIAQCTRIESFLKENGIDIDEENFILENSDVSDIFLDISNFSNEVQEQVYNPDSQELLLLLRQFAFINDAIRRFADEMKTQAEKFLSEIKQLRYQISENMEHHADELNKTTDALQTEIQKERALASVFAQIQEILREASISEEKNKNSQQSKQKQQEQQKKQKQKRVIDNSEEVEFEEEEEEHENGEDESEKTEVVDDDDDDLSKNKDIYILKCLQLIQNAIQMNNLQIDQIYDEARDRNYNSNSNNSQNMYIRKIETKLNNEIEKRRSIEKQSKEEILKLRSKIRQLKKQSSSDKQKFIEEIDYAKKQIDDLSASFMETNDSSSKTKSEIDEKNVLINSLNEKIRQQDKEITKLKGLFDLEKEKIIENYQSQSEKLFREKDEKINTLLLSLESTQNNSQEKVKEVKQDLKQTIKKLQNELALENERANSIRDHYEKLLTDVKNKLSQARNSEKVANEKVIMIENELKIAKSSISKLRIDVKMLSMKVVAADDKLIREKSLFDSQIKMKVLGLQTEHQDQINELKEKYENEIHTLYMKICEIFKDYIDFNMTFSEESVLNILQQVSNALNQSHKKLLKRKSWSSLLCEIKSLLNVTHDKEIISVLTNTINEANEYKDKKLIIENSQKKANFLLKKAKIITNSDNISREWEVWAKRLYLLITDNFSTAKNAKQLQHAIEESLLSAIGQRQLWKKLEILRKEKSILISGVNLFSPKKSKKNSDLDIDTNINSFQSIVSVTAAFISIYRMQKLAGHLKFNIDFSPKKDNC